MSEPAERKSSNFISSCASSFFLSFSDDGQELSLLYDSNVITSSRGRLLPDQHSNSRPFIITTAPSESNIIHDEEETGTIQKAWADA